MTLPKTNHLVQLTVKERGGVSHFRRSSLLCGKTIGISAWLSLGYHLLLFAILANRVPSDLPQFWLFMFCDWLLWILAAIPIVSALRRQLAWYDPLFFVALLFFGMICAFSLAYCLDPNFVRFHVSYGGDALLNCSDSHFLLLVAKAELILSTFMMIFLVVNRRPVNFLPLIPTLRELRAALITSFLCSIGGAVGFGAYWHSRSFLQAITSGIGMEATKTPDLGQARYLILVEIAVTSISLGIVGFLSLKRGPIRQKRKTSCVIIAGGLLAFLLRLSNGARGDVLFSFIVLVVIIRHFDYRVNKKTWIAIALIVMIGVGWITILRGNMFVSQNPSEAIMQVLTGNVAKAYSYQVESIIGTLLALDRVGAIAMVLEYLRLTKEYLYGESLLAGPANTIAYFATRLSMGQFLSPNKYKLANEVTFIWRFGEPLRAGGAVPPSIPGEFYMQFGLTALLILSILYSYFIFWLRKRIAISTSLITRWGFIIIAITLAKLITGELSPLTSILLFAVAPVILIYIFVYALFFSHAS